MDEQNLFNKIMLRIKAEEKAMAIKRKIAILSFILSLSFIGLIPAGKALYLGFSSSGFTQLFSLIFSDTKLVMNLWQSFSLSLLETLPINGILATGFLAIMFLGSFKFLFNNLKNYENRKSIRAELT